MIKIEKKHLKFIIPILFSIILIIITLTVTLRNNDINKLSKVSSEIVTINSSLQTAVTNDEFDHDKACDTLKQNLTSLNKINSNLEAINLKNSSSESLRHSLYNYINLNISLYNSSLDILNNKNQNDFSNLYKKLVTSEKDILQSSTDLANKRLDISFPKAADIFFDSLNKYVNNLYKTNRENDIVSSQKLDFTLYLNNVISNFSTLKEDVQPALIKIREDNRDLSVLVDDIDKKKSDFNKIKNESYSVSIPSGSQDSYEALEDMLNSYEVYINSLDKSVKNEINTSNSDKDSNSKELIDSSYTDTFDKYKSFLSYFDSLENAVSDYKNK